MRVLVSTAQYQDGDRAISVMCLKVRSLFFTTECDRDRDDIDGGCGCRRSI